MKNRATRPRGSQQGLQLAKLPRSGRHHPLSGHYLHRPRYRGSTRMSKRVPASTLTMRRRARPRGWTTRSNLLSIGSDEAERVLDHEGEIVDLLLGGALQLVPEEDTTGLVDGRYVRVELTQRREVLLIVLAHEHQRH